MSWRALERQRYRLNILFGGVYARSTVAFCWASEGPVVRIPTPALQEVPFRRVAELDGGTTS